MKTDTAFVVELDWLSGFEAYFQNDYCKISPKHRQPGTKSVKAALQHVRVLSMWWEAKFKESFSPEKLTNFDLHAYRAHSLDEARIAPDTWNSRLWALRIFCTWIHATFGDTYAGLADGIEPKAQGLRAARYRALTEQEFGWLMHRLERRIREAVTIFEYECAVRDWAIVSVMVYAGLRVEEVSLLDATDITIAERSGSVRVRNGKGSKERIVPLNLTARRALSAWLELRRTDGTALWIGKSTDRISTRQIERIVSQIGSEAKVPGLSPHWLRFTFAKMLEAAGVVIEKIRDLLGHESIETTRRYLRSAFTELQSEVEKLN